MTRVEVWRGKHGDPVPLLGPLPGVRDGDALAYEFWLPEPFTPWPGHSRRQRVFVLLDLGVSLSLPVWRTMSTVDGRVVEAIDAVQAEPTTWYVDLVTVTGFVVRDLYADVMVPTDGRHQRMLDLDELADAVTAGDLDVATAMDGLRRWQRFLDRHLHAARGPGPEWTDFPPSAIRRLMTLPAPLGPAVTAPV